MSASRKRATPSHYNNSINTETASQHVNQTIEDMSAQLREVNKKKIRRFLNQTFQKKTAADETTAAACSTNPPAPPRTPTPTPIAGTPRNTSTLFISQQQANTSFESRLDNKPGFAFTIDEVTYALDRLELTDQAASSSTPSNR